MLKYNSYIDITFLHAQLDLCHFKYCAKCREISEHTSVAFDHLTVTTTGLVLFFYSNSSFKRFFTSTNRYVKSDFPLFV